MNNPEQFINSLKNYEKDNISEKILKKLKGYVNNPKFDPKLIENKS